MPCLVLGAAGTGRTSQRVALVAIAQSSGVAARRGRTVGSRRHSAHRTAPAGRVAAGAGVSVWRVGGRAHVGRDRAPHAFRRFVRNSRRPQSPARALSGGTSPAGGLLDALAMARRSTGTGLERRPDRSAALQRAANRVAADARRRPAGVRHFRRARLGRRFRSRRHQAGRRRGCQALALGHHWPAQRAPRQEIAASVVRERRSDARATSHQLDARLTGACGEIRYRRS